MKNKKCMVYANINRIKKKNFFGFSAFLAIGREKTIENEL